MRAKDVVEIRLHGRGGQGTVTLAALLADAAFRSGWHVLAFPSFGTERTGAPVAAFVRLSREPIRNRSQVRNPNVVAVQDPTLLFTVDVLDGLAPDGAVIVNAPRLPQILESVRNVATAPLTDLAKEHLGAPITSTAMLGFIAGATGLVALEDAVAAVRDRFRGAIADSNEALVRAACEAARGTEAAA
jgi:pyruvate ferredoxin oxidoreductase gamma subunit